MAVIGMLQGRDPSAMLEALRPAGVTTVVACTAPSPRALPATAIAEAARALGVHALAADSVTEALELARARLEPTGDVGSDRFARTWSPRRATHLPGIDELGRSR